MNFEEASDDVDMARRVCDKLREAMSALDHQEWNRRRTNRSNPRTVIDCGPAIDAICEALNVSTVLVAQMQDYALHVALLMEERRHKAQGGPYHHL